MREPAKKAYEVLKNSFHTLINEVVAIEARIVHHHMGLAENTAATVARNYIQEAIDKSRTAVRIINVLWKEIEIEKASEENVQQTKIADFASLRSGLGLPFSIRTIHALQGKYKSVRGGYALIASGEEKQVPEIKTVADLLEHTESELLRRPGLGRKGLNEIKSWIEDQGLSLKIEVPEASRNGI